MNANIEKLLKMDRFEIGDIAYPQGFHSDNYSGLPGYMGGMSFNSESEFMKTALIVQEILIFVGIPA
jgi:hypothetical protein